MPEGADAPLPSMPLLEAVLAVGTDLELRATLQHIVDSAARLTGARHGTLTTHGHSPGPEGPGELFVAGGPAGRDTEAVGNGNRHGAGAGSASGNGSGTGNGDGDGDAIGVPIRVHDEAFGDLLLAGKADGPFTDEDRQLLRVLASQAGIAIGNAHLFEAARQRERWIEGAAAVTTALLTGEEAADALMTVADRARILAGAAAGVILQPTKEGGMSIVAAATDGAPHGWGTSGGGHGVGRHEAGEHEAGGHLSDIRVSENPVSENRMSDKFASDKQSSDNRTSGNHSSDKYSSDKYSSDSRTSDKRTSDKHSSDNRPPQPPPSPGSPQPPAPPKSPTPTPNPISNHNDLIGTTIEPGSAVLTQLLGGEPVFIEDSATDPRMTTHVRVRFGPSMMLPLQAGGRLIGTLALPRRRGAPAYTAAERLLATQFASQAALALVLADAQQSRQRLAVFEDRDRIARDLHDLVVQRLFATGMMLESTRRRAQSAKVQSTLDHAVDELESTIQEVRTAIFALQQPPADAPATFRGKVLRETAGAGAVLGVQPSVHFAGPVDNRITDPAAGHLLAALRRALAATSRRTGVTRVDVAVDARTTLPDGREGVRLTVYDDGATDGVEAGTTVTWQAPL